MYVLILLRKYPVKVVLIAPTQLATSSLNKSALPERLYYRKEPCQDIVRNTNRLLLFLAVRLAGLTCGIVAAVSLVTAAAGTFNGGLPLGIALGAALGFGRLCVTGRLFPQGAAGSEATRRRTAVVVANQLLGLALTAVFLVFCVKKSVWLFSGGAAGLLLIPAVIVFYRKKIAAL
jgi:hypothetical protein